MRSGATVTTPVIPHRRLRSRRLRKSQPTSTDSKTKNPTTKTAATAGVPEGVDELPAVRPATRKDSEAATDRASRHLRRVVAKSMTVGRVVRQAQHLVVGVVERLGQQPGHVVIGWGTAVGEAPS